eukprot:TRINITY_DN26554_c0_g1_i1.p1 TRINITY_DN26554_c0_g1~~TRINITY_DN26554_c0_g1_i1.p1  ORF type:complete len:445 (+),score=158.61 TRINITY_DN26554_c0_g1_i1:121-1455(+)
MCIRDRKEAKMRKARDLRARNLVGRLKNLQLIEKRMSAHQKILKTKLEDFTGDSATVRLKLGMHALKEQTKEDAWEAFQKKRGFLNARLPEHLTKGDKKAVLSKLAEVADSGSMADLTVAASQDIPDLKTMDALQKKFGHQLKEFSMLTHDNAKLRKERDQEQTKYEIAQQQIASLQAELKEVQDRNTVMSKRHNSLESNAKWEITKFKRKKTMQALQMQNRYIQHGVMDTALAVDEPDKDTSAANLSGDNGAKPKRVAPVAQTKPAKGTKEASGDNDAEDTGAEAKDKTESTKEHDASKADASKGEAPKSVADSKDKTSESKSESTSPESKDATSEESQTATTANTKDSVAKSGAGTKTEASASPPEASKAQDVAAKTKHTASKTPATQPESAPKQDAPANSKSEASTAVKDDSKSIPKGSSASPKPKAASAAPAMDLSLIHI